MRKQKRYLRNANGENYEILGQRRSDKYVNWKGQPVNDYLVKSEKGTVIIANGWDTRSKTWKHGTYYRKPIKSIHSIFKKRVD